MGTQELKSQQGFTLVELAIVMIIIGLLITGILQGGQLIHNAQVNRAVQQVNGIDAAVSTFRDAYNGIPGDLPSAGTRIPGCAASTLCDGPTNASWGDGILNSVPDATPGTEAQAFYLQLNLAGIFSGGIDESSGILYPQLDIGGIFQPGSSAAGANGDFGNAEWGAAAWRAGLYLTLNGAAGTMNAAIPPNDAQRIDTKVDDGDGETGSVRAFHNGTDNACFNAGFYVEATETPVCGMYIRIQQ